jgi:hypothetical protein
VAHFEGFRVHVRGRGVFPGVLISLPRADEDLHAKYCVTAREALVQRAALNAERKIMQLCSKNGTR